MTSCNRDSSPIVRKGKERHTELILQDGKVHRLQLNAPVICKLAYVESPNCIWFTLHNNIADQLVVIKPAHLEPLLPSKKDLNNNATKEDSPVARFSHQIAEIAKMMDDEEVKKNEPPIYQYQYVLAPLQENVYARGRIIFLQDFKTLKAELQFAYVHFIDRGYGNWMSTKCLAKMEPQHYLHPWQAFPVSLFRLGVDPEDQLQQWPFELTYSLIEVLTDYEYFKVVPVIDSRRNQNYYEYKRAEVYGLESLKDIVEEEGKAESIAHRLLIEFGEQMAGYEEDDKENGQKQPKSGQQMKMEKMVDQMSSMMLESCFDRSLYDAKQQKLLREPKPKLTLEELGEMPKWRLNWPKHFGVGKPQTENEAMMNGEINEEE